MPKRWKVDSKNNLDEANVASASATLAASLAAPGPEIKTCGKRWKSNDAAKQQAEPAEPPAANSGGSSGSRPSFREVASQLFLTNKLSALQTHDVVHSAQDAGATGSEDMARAGGSGRHPKNMCRDLTRTLLKNIIWPDEYWAEIPIRNPDDGTMHMVSFPFLLPHEVLRHLLEANGLAKILEFISQELTKSFCDTTGCDPAVTLPIGLHGDGAPFAAKMRDSLEQFSWNLCADPKSSRVVFTAIPKKFVGEGTFDAILEIFAWSMRVLLLGRMPTKRHDGTPFNETDSSRRKQMSGAALEFHACLVQIRGDWAFYKGCFNFPSWSAEQICWLRRATKPRGSRFDFRCFVALCLLFSLTLNDKSLTTQFELLLYQAMRSHWSLERHALQAWRVRDDPPKSPENFVVVSEPMLVDRALYGGLVARSGYRRISEHFGKCFIRIAGYIMAWADKKRSNFGVVEKAEGLVQGEPAACKAGRAYARNAETPWQRAETPF